MASMKNERNPLRIEVARDQIYRILHSEMRLDNTNLLNVATHILHVSLNPDHDPTPAELQLTERQYVEFLVNFAIYAIQFIASLGEGNALVSGYFSQSKSGAPANHPVWEAFKKFVNSLSDDQRRSMQLSVPNVDRLLKAIASNRPPHLPALRHHEFKVR